MFATCKKCILSLIAVSYSLTLVAAEPSAVKAPPKTHMVTAGKVLLDLPLNQVPDKSTARSNVGDWSVSEGTLTGAERAADMHGAVMRFR